jgi:hypothetical protein
MLDKIRPTSFLTAISIAFSALLFVQGAALAQTDSGKISGVVRDQNGAVVPGSAVTAINDRTGEERTATSNAEGSFSIPALKAATYTVTATTTGLGAKVQNVEVNVGKEVNLSVTLKVMELTASINIVASEEVTVTTGSASM